MKNPLSVRETLAYTLSDYDTIWKALINQKIWPELAVSIERIDLMTSFYLNQGMPTHIVGKYGWVHLSSMDKNRADDESDLCERILQSGALAKWHGQGPFERSISCRVHPKYIGKSAYLTEITFVEGFANDVYGRKSDVLVMVESNGEIIPVPAQYASFHCPSWDNNHPSVLAWLEEWKWAVGIEEQTGFNPMFDFI